MRIIHTSDWHLGQHFMGKSREAEHRAFLDWLGNLIIQSSADALVVAGDIFDTGTPPSYARAMYNDFIVSLQKTGCSMTVVLGGNHDSPATLNEAKPPSRLTSTGRPLNMGDCIICRNVLPSAFIRR